MNKERNCQACIHHISGLCTKWDCEMQTLEDYRDKVINDVFDFLKNKRDKRNMKICFDDLEIRKYKEQMKEGCKNE